MLNSAHWKLLNINPTVMRIATLILWSLNRNFKKKKKGTKGLREKVDSRPGTQNIQDNNGSIYYTRKRMYWGHIKGPRSQLE